jgi:opacity protein-like surface antigen
LERNLTMKKITWVTSLCLVFLAGAASADEGLAVGASYGYTSIEGSDGGLSLDLSDTGYKLFGSYTFGNGFGIEGGYVDFGKPDDTLLGQVATIDASGWDLYGVGNLGVSDTVDLFAKAGFISWEADSFINGVQVDVDDGEDLALGAGARWDATDALGIRAEFEWFDISDTDAVWMASVGFELRF